MNPRPVMIGAIVANIFLAVFLFWLTSKIVYPSTTLGFGGNNSSSELSSQEAPKQVEMDAICAISELFPQNIQQWCGLITFYANQHGLHPDLVAALIWQESGGDPLAYSRSGAVGLMQVMPRDGLAASFMCKNGPCFSDRPTTEELKDPEFNIAYGTRLLSKLLAHYGTLRDALKSYGPKDVGYYYADIVLGLFQQYGQ